MTRLRKMMLEELQRRNYASTSAEGNESGPKKTVPA